MADRKRAVMEEWDGGKGSSSLHVEVPPSNFSGKHESDVKLLYRLSGNHDFSGGGVTMAVCPISNELTIAITSVCLVITISTETGKLLTKMRQGGMLKARHVLD